MSVFAVFIVIMVVMRLKARRRLWRGYPAPMWQHHHWHHGPRRFERTDARPMMSEPPVPAPVKQETAYELLKKRYVAGHISDQQYERELDALLRTPEGRAQVQ